MQQAGAGSLSGYGAGKCDLAEGAGRTGPSRFEDYLFDPAFPDFGPLKPAGWFVAMEYRAHRAGLQAAVFARLESVTRLVGKFVDRFGPSGEDVGVGRKALLVERPRSWWLRRLWEMARIVEYDVTRRT